MTWRFVRISCLLIVALVAFATSSYSDSSQIEKRDAALKRIATCLKRNEVSSRECKNMSKDIQVLVDVYRQGDKSVLPTLLQFAYLRDFLGDALIGDTDGFFSAVLNLSEPNQQAVAVGLAGEMSGLQRTRFETIRATLMLVSDSSPNYQLARTFLQTLETENASLLENYFPPQTFAGQVGDLQVHWFSRYLHALEQKPLWSPALKNEHTYRITVLPAFSAPQAVVLTVLADGSGQIGYYATESTRMRLGVATADAISAQEVADFTSSLDQIQFWQLPTEVPQRGFDGAEWILEAVQDGKYHLVHRWCPGKTSFGEVGRSLFNFAGHKMLGAC